MKINSPSFRDVEQVSALLDGKLSPADAARLRARLDSDPNLRTIMDDLAQSRGLLRRLPARRAPRNFTLTRKMSGVNTPLPRSVPTLRFATLLATFLLVFSMATNALAPVFRQAASAPAYGMGGGGGGGVDQPPEALSAATQAPVEQGTPGLAPATQAPALPEAGSSLALETPTPDATLKALAPAEQLPAQPVQPEPSSAPVPLIWQIGLLVLALVSGGLAWLLRSASDRSWRGKTK